MSVSARALYDYSARSDKELSFKRGQTLKVIEKSPDGHWWDGLSGSNRGFIPVAYVEIIELLQPTPVQDSVAIPPPPVRKSSVQDREDEVGMEGAPLGKLSELPAGLKIDELVEPSGPSSREPSRSPELPAVMLTTDLVSSPGTKTETAHVREHSPAPEPDKLEEPHREPVLRKPPIPSVKSLTKQFATPPAPQQQVLVQPHRKTHSDLSPRKSYEPPSSKGTVEPESIGRSSSTSGRVTQLSNQLSKVPLAGPPPPTKPRPAHGAHILSPGSEKVAAAFNISPHSSTSGSPLQRAQLGSQLPPSKPSASRPGKPAPGKVKRDWSQKKEERPPVPAHPSHPPYPARPKPLPPPVPGKSNELQAELQAAMKRKASDK